MNHHGSTATRLLVALGFAVLGLIAWVEQQSIRKSREIANWQRDEHLAEIREKA